jgi:hypothetical protein
LRPELRENKETEQFQQKRTAVLRPELRENEQIERSRDSEKSGDAPESES